MAISRSNRWAYSSDVSSRQAGTPLIVNILTSHPLALGIRIFHPCRHAPRSVAIRMAPPHPLRTRSATRRLVSQPSGARHLPLRDRPQHPGPVVSSAMACRAGLRSDLAFPWCILWPARSQNANPSDRVQRPVTDSSRTRNGRTVRQDSPPSTQRSPVGTPLRTGRCESPRPAKTGPRRLGQHKDLPCLPDPASERVVDGSSGSHYGEALLLSHRLRCASPDRSTLSQNPWV